MTQLDLVPPDGSDWIGVSELPLPVADAGSWAVVPSCGAVVTFCGTVRDHSAGRPDVTALEYEAYVEQVVPRLDDVADSARSRWPDIGRLVLLHRIGHLVVGDVSVVVVASTPHRHQAFDAAHYCIDTLKHSVPIWKRESWAGGSDWSLCSQTIEDPSRARRTSDSRTDKMIPLEEARRFVLGSCTALTPRSLPLDEALGCVIGAPIVASEPIPPFTNASMDGYALRARDTRRRPRKFGGRRFDLGRTSPRRHGWTGPGSPDHDRGASAARARTPL